MNKYKYRLTEQSDAGEETPVSGNLREKNYLYISALGKYNLDDILDMLKNPDPKFLQGVYVPYSESDKEIKLNIYGNPNIRANIKKNEQLLASQTEKYGKPFYQYVEDELGKKFIKIKPNGFPDTNKDNNALVDEYTKLTKTKGKIKTGLKTEKTPDGESAKFLTDNLSITEKTVNRILNNAGLVEDVDYVLERKKSIEEQIKKRIKETINKLFEENIEIAPADKLFYDVKELIRTRTRQMNDNDAYEFHEKLKKWTNSLI
jgi:hypothetical protein